MAILVTGGTGYIGSHTVVELINNGFEVVIVDNLSNSNCDVLIKIEQLTGIKPTFYQVDITNKNELSGIFLKHSFTAVIHFAALKAVGDSVNYPLAYYANNVTGTLVLLSVMQEFKVKTFVFSSSATVYGEPKEVPVNESSEIMAINPYGRTKVMIEQILNDMYIADNSWCFAILRYFNPVGAHSSGLLGENPNGTPNNLMPYIAQVATGQREYLNVYGNDYSTPDGTGVRDYIHVVDLAIGHIKALEYINQTPQQQLIVNLGTGVGYSVLDVINAYQKISGKKIAYKFTQRRAGDVAVLYANVDLAYKLLNFKTQYSLDDMCLHSWNFQNKVKK
jgi:UDP-glucose 4-epimerase